MKLNHNKKSVKISLNLFALYAVMVCGIVFALPAFAASDPLVVVENLSTFIFSLIRAVGLILLGWGIVQVGLSLQSHDPSQRSQGFLTLAGGLVITFAKEILDLITAWRVIPRGRTVMSWWVSHGSSANLMPRSPHGTTSWRR